MSHNAEHISGQALQLLRSLCTEHGILASAIESDNYRRIWARDSIVAGLAGLLAEDTIVLKGLKDSLKTLADHQHEMGMIPSNVQPETGSVSYGSLTGRIDASTWFIIGSVLYYLESGDRSFYEDLTPAIQKALTFLKCCEFNACGWLYTPLSGNWADEYPVHGFTLYDNCLYVWAKKLLLKAERQETGALKEDLDRLSGNFWPGQPNGAIYHKAGYEQALAMEPHHYACFILPGYYDLRFDTAGNALALLLLEPNKAQQTKLKGFLKGLENELNSPLTPAFWPVIDKDQPDWKLLANNYAYAFKNKPGHFHNGGIWPVWTGLLALGMAANGMQPEATRLAESYFELIASQADWDFDEYHYAFDLSPCGKQKMAYTASGIVFMQATRSGTQQALNKLSLNV